MVFFGSLKQSSCKSPLWFVNSFFSLKCCVAAVMCILRKKKIGPSYKGLFSYFMHCRSVVCFWFSNNLCVFLLQSAAACGMEAQSDAIQPSHIREAIRRYGHKIGPLSPFTVRNNRAIKSYIYNLKELWFSSGQMKKLWNCWEQFVVTVIFFIKVASFSWEIKLCNFCLFWEGQKGWVFLFFVFFLNIIFFQLQIMFFLLLLLRLNFLFLQSLGLQLF